MNLALLLTLLLPAADPAPADENALSMLGRYKLDCLVCGIGFTSTACPQSNLRGGVDRDLFARAVGPQPEFYRIATCPKCGYSGYPADFDPAVILPPGFRERVLNSPELVLPKDFGPESDPRDLDAAQRYKLAITCYEWQGKSDEALGWLHLRASWVAREEGAVLPPDERLVRVMRFVERWRPELDEGDNQADEELRTAARMAEALEVGRFNRFQRPYVELAMCLILRRHGENVVVAPLLDRLEKEAPFSKPLAEAVARMRGSIVTERGHQAKAAECFERALLAERISAVNRGPACYLLGELYRRLDRDSEATRWYTRALSDPALPKNLAEWARQQQASLSAQKSPQEPAGRNQRRQP